MARSDVGQGGRWEASLIVGTIASPPGRTFCTTRIVEEIDMALNSLPTLCANCGGTQFELADAPVAGAAHKLYFVRCAGCRSAVSVLEAGDATALIYRLAAKLHVDLTP